MQRVIISGIGIYKRHTGYAGCNSSGIVFLRHRHHRACSLNGSWTGAFVQYKPPLVADAPENVHVGTEEDVYGDGSLLLDLWRADLSDGNPAHFNGIGVLEAKEFHCDAEGDVVIHLLNDSNGDY